MGVVMDNDAGKYPEEPENCFTECEAHKLSRPCSAEQSELF